MKMGFLKGKTGRKNSLSRFLFAGILIGILKLCIHFLRCFQVKEIVLLLEYNRKNEIIFYYNLGNFVEKKQNNASALHGDEYYF